MAGYPCPWRETRRLALSGLVTLDLTSQSYDWPAGSGPLCSGKSTGLAGLIRLGICHLQLAAGRGCLDGCQIKVSPDCTRRLWPVHWYSPRQRAALDQMCERKFRGWPEVCSACPIQGPKIGWALIHWSGVAYSLESDDVGAQRMQAMMPALKMPHTGHHKRIHYERQQLFRSDGKVALINAW